MIDPMTYHLMRMTCQDRLAAAKFACEQASSTVELNPIAKLRLSLGAWLIAFRKRMRQAGAPARSLKSMAERR
jgi:hypothetical protein